MVKFDPALATHVSKVQKNWNICCLKLKLDGKEGSKKRGALVTFISKTTVNTIVNIIRIMLQNSISAEVKLAKIYSIQVDSSQDVSSLDQFSLVIRYVNNATIHERLLAMIPSKEGSRQGLFNLVNATLKQHSLDLKGCISNCTDEAVNYHGQYKELQSKIVEAAALQVHTWCYAHVLNLVIMDTSKCYAASISMFVLLQNAFSFLKVWIEVVK